MMNEKNLREQLEIDTKLKLLKEHKCCAESILCIETYMYCIELESQQLKEQLKQRDIVIDEVMRYIKKNTKYYDREYSKIYGELCDMAGAGDTRLHVVIGDEELLEILQKYKGDNNG